MTSDSDKQIKKYLESKYPLLEKFRSAAPGTFKHCQNLMAICEAIASDLELDIDLIKCAAQYHDIGKINNPKLFSENQDESEENIHDKMDPYISYQLITKHVGDSILILLHEAADMPIEVLRIISEHHGNSIMKHFFLKSKSEIDDLFRYKCQPPSTIESSILMIVDSVEAAIRATTEKIKTSVARKNLITNIIEGLIEDDQLNNLTYGIGKAIKSVLIREVDSIFHKRVSYENEEELLSDSSDEKEEDING